MRLNLLLGTNAIAGNDDLIISSTRRVRAACCEHLNCTTRCTALYSATRKTAKEGEKEIGSCYNSYFALRHACSHTLSSSLPNYAADSPLCVGGADCERRASLRPTDEARKGGSLPP